MKIGEYEQMMSYLTRPGFKNGSPLVPEPKPLTAEEFKSKADLYIKGALGGFDKGEMINLLQKQLDKVQESGTMSKEEAINFINERTQQLREFIKENPGETLPGLDRENFRDGTKQYDYKNPQQKNQYVMRSNEDIQKIIDDPKYKDYTRKDFRNEKILTRKETEREGLEFKNFGKKKKKPENLENTKRTEKIKKTQGANISVKGSGQTGKQFSHVYPLIQSAKPGTKTTGTIDAKMNRALEGYNKIGQDIAEQQELLIKNKPEGYKQELVKLNARAKKNVMNAVSDLGKEYKGQIGYFQVDPDTGEFKPKAGNYKMSFAGIEGENKIFKDMTGKERKDFERKISAIEKAKTIPGVTTADKIKRPESAKTRDMIKDFEIRTNQLGSNLGLIKGVGETIKAIPTPTGTLALTAGLGVDPTSAIDRVALGAEAAFAPELVKQTSRLTSNPIVQRFFNLGLSPQMAMRAARIASPLGVASLAGEGVYQLYKAGQAERAKLEAMTPEERAGYLRAQEAENMIAAADGGLIRKGFADGPDDPSKRKFMKIMGGLASLPIVGKFIKPAAKVAPAALEAAKGMPEWFGALVDKVIRKGTDMTKSLGYKDRQEVYGTKISDDEMVIVYKDLDDGSVRVEYQSPENMGEASVDLTYKPSQSTEDGMIPADFRAVEAEPRGIRSGPDDYDIEFDGENVVESVDDLNSDLGRLEFFATDKMPDLKKIEKSNEKRKRVQKLNEDQVEQAEYLETKYGPGEPGDPYVDYSDYD